MTAPDPLAPLLDGLRVPAMPASLADRIAAEAVRPDRVPAPAPTLPPRRRLRRWTRRGVWTTVVAVNLIVASAVAAAIGGGVIDPHRIVAAAHRIVEHIRHPRAEHAVAQHAPVAAHHAIANVAPRPTRPSPAMIAPMPAMPRALVASPIRPGFVHGPAMRIAAAPPLRHPPAMVRAHPRPLRPDRAERLARHANRRDRPTPIARPGRSLAERSPAPISPPALRDEAPISRSEPLHTEAPATGVGQRWRQRGWRNWQNRQGAPTTMPDTRQPIEAGERQNRQPNTIDRPQQRRGGFFRPGRRFSEGPRRGGGGRRRF